LTTPSGENVPAPWVPFTRAGCDVGAFSPANIALERSPFDVQKVFGQNSSQANEDSDHQNADFIGEAIHCVIGVPRVLTPTGRKTTFCRPHQGRLEGTPALLIQENVERRRLSRKARAMHTAKE
jgi:hypothetical protein